MVTFKITREWAYAESCLLELFRRRVTESPQRYAATEKTNEVVP